VKIGMALEYGQQMPDGRTLRRVIMTFVYCTLSILNIANNNSAAYQWSCDWLCRIIVHVYFYFFFFNYFVVLPVMVKKDFQ